MMKDYANIRLLKFLSVFESKQRIQTIFSPDIVRNISSLVDCFNKTAIHSRIRYTTKNIMTFMLNTLIVMVQHTRLKNTCVLAIFSEAPYHMNTYVIMYVFIKDKFIGMKRITNNILSCIQKKLEPALFYPQHVYRF